VTAPDPDLARRLRRDQDPDCDCQACADLRAAADEGDLLRAILDAIGDPGYVVAMYDRAQTQDYLLALADAVAAAVEGTG